MINRGTFFRNLVAFTGVALTCASSLSLAATGINNLAGGLSLGDGPTLGNGPTGLDNLFGSCVDTSGINPGVYNSTGGTTNSTAKTGLQQNSFYQNLLSGLAGAANSSLSTLSLDDGSTDDPGPMCNGADSVDGSGITCDSSDGEVAARKRSIRNALAVVSCKMKKLQSVPAQLSCLTDQANKLDDLIDQLKQTLADTLSKAHEYVAEINTVIDDRDQQIKDVNYRLNGGENGNPPGLLALEKETQNMVTRLYGGVQQVPTGTDGATQKTVAGGEIQAIKLAMTENQNQRANLAEQIKAKTMGYVNQCFTSKPKNGLTCQAGGAFVSVKEYVLCRFEQNQMVGTGGRIENDKTTKLNASTRSRSLDSLLTSIFEDTPQSGSLPIGDAQQFQQLFDKPLAHFTAADVEAQYGDQLASFNGAGLDIHDFVMKQLNSCFSYAQDQVTTERNNKDSSISRFEEQIKVAEQKVSDQVNSLLEDVKGLFNKGMAGLTGLAFYQLNTQFCETTDPQKQLSCLQDAGNQMKGMLNGTTPQSQISMIVKANNPKLDVSFQCNGIRQCVTTLNTLNVNLGKEKARLDSFKSEYVAKVNASADRFLAQVTSQLKGPAQFLKKQLQMLNANMAVLGTTINVPDIDGKGAKFEPEDDKKLAGLYKMPDDVKALVAGHVDPKIPDLASNNLSDALKGLGDVVKDMNQKQSKLSEASAAIEGTRRKCLAQQRAGAIQSARDAASQLRSCKPSKDQCSKQASSLRDALAQANAARAQAGGTTSTNANGGTVNLQAEINGLTNALNGYRRACSEAGSGQGDPNCDGVIEDVQRSLAGASSGGGGTGGFDSSAFAGAFQGLINGLIMGN